MAQDFFAAFGHDGVGQSGTEETTINSGDMAGILMIAVQSLEKRTAEIKEKDTRIAALEKEGAAKDARIGALEAKQSLFETIAARFEALELKLQSLCADQSRENPRRGYGSIDPRSISHRKHVGAGFKPAPTSQPLRRCAPPIARREGR